MASKVMPVHLPSEHRVQTLERYRSTLTLRMKYEQLSLEERMVIQNKIRTLEECLAIEKKQLADLADYKVAKLLGCQQRNMSVRSQVTHLRFIPFVRSFHSPPP